MTALHPLAYDPDVMTRALGELRRHPVPATEKGFSGVAQEGPVAPAALVRRHVGAGGFATPLLVLRDTAVRANVATMAAYCKDASVELAPHAKTTMAPQLFERQLEAGAWGLTAATVRQARVYRAFGVRRILLANQLADPAAIAWVAAERERDETFEFCCYVDSVAGVRLLDEALRPSGAEHGRRLPVLVELGWPGGRTGARGVGAALDVARAAAATDSLCVVGAACFEGVVGHGTSAEVLDGVARFCAELRRLGEAIRPLVTCGLDGVPGPAPLVLTAGGSAYFDVVVRELTDAGGSGDVAVVLRSGCYVTHDHGAYAETSPFERGTAGSGRLVPALELWARVLSRPEPGLAYLDAGRRDVAFDEGMPIPLTIRTRGGDERAARDLTVTKLNDQHAFVRVDASTELTPGDLVRLGISHPCTTFDKWRVIPMLDDDDRIVDIAHTFF
ncbi:MAG: alanine racemase [Streptosporangiaceae bacterium]